MSLKVKLRETPCCTKARSLTSPVLVHADAKCLVRTVWWLKARAHAFSGPYLQPTCFKLRLSFCLRPFDPGNILRFRFFLRQSKCFIRFPTSINLKDDNRNFFFRCQLYLTYPYTFSKRIL